ncbi:MAG: hypothetical protein CL823_05855 [Crocinitomicaceae bacterium]|nr:hypothetical protein [Crocinitomicaceae bacterium]
MKNHILIVFCLAICFLAIAPNSHAQVTSGENAGQSASTSKWVRIVTQSGGIIEGKVLEISLTYFLLDTPLMGQTQVNKDNIAAITYITEDQIGGGSFMNTRSTDINPQSSRYFFSPSAHSLKKGEGYYHNVWLAYNSLSFGVSDNATVGFTMTPFGTGGTAKIGHQVNDNVTLSVGGIAVLPFFDTGDLMPGLAGIGFANITLGSERKNVSFNYGIASFMSQYRQYFTLEPYEQYDEDGNYIGMSPEANHYYDIDGDGYDEYVQMSGWNWVTGRRNFHVINMSAMVEVNSKLWIMTENYHFMNTDRSTGNNTDISFLIMGIRKASSKRDALWDVGMIAIPQEEVAGIPWLGVTVPF